MEGLGDRRLNRTWRLLVTPPASGGWNMALDEALFESVKAGGPPFLRFYSWNPSTLSLGRFQSTAGLTPVAASVPRVRRTTGGGGIWHADELTYSLGCSQEDLGLTGVKASFEKLCGFLVDSWINLGWDARFAKDAATTSLGIYAPACFAGTEEYDILVGARKLGGNAQRRDRAAIFQHGSIPLSLDHGVLEDLFQPGFRPEPSAITDLQTCGWRGTTVDLIALLTRSFGSRVGAEWREDSPTGEERERLEALLSEKFGNPVWTENGGGNLRAP